MLNSKQVLLSRAFLKEDSMVFIQDPEPHSASFNAGAFLVLPESTKGRSSGNSQDSCSLLICLPFSAQTERKTNQVLSFSGDVHHCHLSYGTEMPLILEPTPIPSV